jgi:peptidoglycan/xylan/chitin deacetylase (PgdA/CDA1 family)
MVEYNARETRKCEGEPLDNMEDLGRWDTYAGLLEVATETNFVGTRCARLTATPSDSRAWIYRTFDGGIDLSTVDLSMAVNPSGGETHVDSVRVQLLAPDRDNRLDMLHYCTNVKGWFRMDFGPTEIVGSPDLTDVRELRISTWTGGGSREVFYVDDIRLTERGTDSNVVFTFDDNPISQYERAFPVLEEFDYPAVAGVIPSYVGREDRISKPQLVEMQTSGWDIVSHPQLSEPLPDVSPARQRQAIRSTKQWLIDNGFEDGARFTIWPYGAADGTALATASRYHYLGFGSGGTTNSFTPTGPLTLTRVSGDDPEAARRAVDFAVEYDRTAAIVYHTIEDSEGSIDREEFRNFVEYVADADASVLTASEFWSNIER